MFTAADPGKFWRSWDTSVQRKSDSKILEIYEPIGSAFFRASNINTILEALKPDNFTLRDIQPVMERTWHSWGTREAEKYVKWTADDVANRVALMNELVVEEVRKMKTMTLNEREIANHFMDNPNVSGHQWLPQSVRMTGTKVRQNVRYIEPPDADSPFPYLEIPNTIGQPPSVELFDIPI